MDRTGQRTCAQQKIVALDIRGIWHVKPEALNPRHPHGLLAHLRPRLRPPPHPRHPISARPILSNVSEHLRLVCECQTKLRIV